MPTPTALATDVAPPPPLTTPRHVFLACAGIALVIAAPHVLASPGYTTIAWGDYGRWLHEAERFATGEALYRDFVWPFPPLALWIVGGWMRFFGADLASVHVLMSLVTIAILLLHAWIVARLLPPAIAMTSVGVSVALALALAQRESAALPLGMYTPAAPLAILLLLAAIAVSLLGMEGRSAGRLAALGALCGAMILTKQDAWIPAAYLVHMSRSAMTAAVATATLACGVLVIVATAGVDVLPGVATGFGHVREFGMYGLPDWEGLTVAGIATAGFGAGLLLVAGTRHRLAVMAVALAVVLSALHLVMSIDQSVVPSIPDAVWHLARRVSTQVPPILLPAAVAAIVAWQVRHDVAQRSLLLTFLGLCLAARVRRGFQFTEWYHVLLELPLYALVVLHLVPGDAVRRRVWWGLVALVPVVGAAEWSLGRIPLIGIGRLEAIDTPRGTARWRPSEIAEYRWLAAQLRRADPAGTRPFLAFGYTGGYSYFLARTNPTGNPLGFGLSRFDPDSVVAAVLRHDPPALVLDTRPYYEELVRAPGIPLTSWTWPTRLQHFLRHDRTYFEQILAQCPAIARYEVDMRAAVVLHSCDRKDRPDAGGR